MKLNVGVKGRGILPVFAYIREFLRAEITGTEIR